MSQVPNRSHRASAAEDRTPCSQFEKHMQHKSGSACDVRQKFEVFANLCGIGQQGPVIQISSELKWAQEGASANIELCGATSMNC